MTYSPTHAPNAAPVAPAPPGQYAPAKVLHKLLTEGQSGRLILSDPNDASVQWCVYFGGGQIHFAGSLMGQQERLTYLFNRAGGGETPKVEFSGSSDYQMVYDYWRSHRLPLNGLREILSTLTQDALVQFLAVPQGVIKYQSSIGLDPLLLSVPFRQLLMPIRDTISQWGQLKADVSSPFLRPQLDDYEACLKLVWNDNELCQQLQEVTSLMRDNLTIYEVATRLSVDALTVSRFLQPLVQSGGVSFNRYQTPKVAKRPTVVCVDDSPTIQQFVKLSLESSGYSVLSFLDPTQVIDQLRAEQPVVILMDIEMPSMDGYELCRMARQVETLRPVPIVMLTGREGIIDRVRARMAGCTAYLTKPFNPKELLELVQKLAQSQPASSL
ncbi:MAG: response regulator [Thermosynechococcaceae cyanobacterium MS004]|nr:response regulator [Thermosynechococcaceae cyanobacterium MS004]